MSIILLKEFIKLNVNRHDDKKCETCGTKYEYFWVEYTNLKDELMEYKCLYCNKNYQQNFD